MKKFLMIMLMIPLLISCDNKPSKQVGKDGYYFEKETFTRTDFPVEVRLLQSEKEMIAEFKKRVGRDVNVDPKSVIAFAVIRPNDNRCTIYMLDPKVKYQPEYIGHEFVHCIYGEWHREPQT